MSINREYRKKLEENGMNSDSSYDVAETMRIAHKSFSLLSHQSRLDIQQLWGDQFIVSLEKWAEVEGKNAQLFTPTYVDKYDIQPEKKLSWVQEEA